MGKSYPSNIYANIKRRVIVLSVLLVAILIGVVVTSIFVASTLSTSSSVINVLGRQRMYTQAIGKNSSRIYVLYSAASSDDRVQEREVLLSKAVITKEELEFDTSEFDRILEGLSRGVVKVNDTEILISDSIFDELQTDIDRLITLWGPYHEAVNVIRDSQTIDTPFREALIIINENNDELLDYTQHITNRFDELITVRYQYYRNWSYVLVALFIIVAFILVRGLYLYLFSSINVLYSEFEKLGIDHEQNTMSSKKNSLKDEIKTLLSGFTETLDLVERINASSSFNETLQYIFDSFSKYLPYTYIGIALLKDTDPQTVVATYGIGDGHHPGLAKALVNHEVALEETSLGKIMKDSKPRVINNMDEYFETREIKAYSEVILNHGIKSSITLPLKANGMPLGFIFFSSNKENVYQDKHIEYLKLISNSIALSFDKNIFSEELVYSSVLALAKLSEARDEDTGTHLVRMSQYVGIIAKALSEQEAYQGIINHKFIQEIIKFSPMHDIGKVGIPDSILLKPGKLSNQEFEVMKSHTTYGGNVLNEAEKNIKRSGKSMFSMGQRIALYHHEKYDGSGYPEGLVGDEIPIEARIVAVADVFDALMSKRPYKEAFTVEETIRIMNAGRGTHFDPVILDALLENLNEFIIIKNTNQ